MAASSTQNQNQARQGKRKKSHKKVNWAEYDKSLVQRGNMTFWFSDEAVEGWHPEFEGPPRIGQPRYSDTAIESSLTIRLLFKQGLRQTEGFVQSLLKLMNLDDLKAPDHTTLSRRSKTLDVAIALKATAGKSLTVIVDSTGLKVCGPGEWTITKHGQKRRRWRKLHLCIDEGTVEIVSHDLTTEKVGDSTAAATLLEPLPYPIDEGLADGAYDKQPFYDLIEKHAAGGRGKVTVPPRKDAQRSSDSGSPPTQRDKHVDFINKHGKEAWKYAEYYFRRLKVENAMYRYKTIIGRHMRSRTLKSQKTEAALGCKILNQMSYMGLPRHQAVA